MHRLVFEENLTRCWLVHTGHGFDEGRLARAIIAQQAMTLTRFEVETDTGQRNHRPKVLLDVDHTDDRLSLLCVAMVEFGVFSHLSVLL